MKISRRNKKKNSQELTKAQLIEKINSLSEIKSTAQLNLENQLNEVNKSLLDARIKYRHVIQSENRLKKLVSDSEINQTTLKSTEEKLSQLTAEYRNLLSRIEISEAKLKAKDFELESLKRLNLKNRILINEKELEKNELLTTIDKYKNDILKVKNHLSYKLGNLLIKTSNNWSQLFHLPVALYQLRKEAKFRRNIIVSKIEESQKQLQYTPVLETKKNIELLNRELSYLPILDDATKLRSIKIACIMDTFTYESYSHEAVLLQLTPENYQTELEKFSPDMLFIESAWRGKDALWGNKVGHTSSELVNIIKWCKANNTPTMFWNKEDPVHFETFLNTAKLFDHIFTTDIDCVGRYKKALKHNNVYFLPFAAQPVVNNPIEKYQRKDRFCFAGAYYLKYPERTKDLNNFILSLPEYRQIDIYDRNFGKNDPNYMFPEEYNPFIIGTLPYEEIDKAYKGYYYAINLNSIKQSQSMFARRVYELLASNTITASNFSHGLRVIFGDLVCTSDSGEEIVRRLEKISLTEDGLKLFRLAGLRKVMLEHTYQDRLAYIYSKLSNNDRLKLLPEVVVISYAKNTVEFDAVVASFNKQEYPHKKLLIVATIANDYRKDELNENVSVISVKESEKINIQEISQTWLATFVASDYYGPHYLVDLVIATRYTHSGVIGKKSSFRWENEDLVKAYENHEYKVTSGLVPRSSIFNNSTLPSISCADWIKGMYTFTSDTHENFAIDPYNYCMNGYGYCEPLTPFSELTIDTGISLIDMQAHAEQLTVSNEDIGELQSLSGDELYSLIRPGKNSCCVTEAALGKMKISSSLEDGKHEYWYSRKDFSLSEMNIHNSTAKLHLETSPGLNIQYVLVYLDANKQKISHSIHHANKNITIAVPLQCHFIRIGLRIYASGIADISALYLDEKPAPVIHQLATQRYLILTNHYPSYENLYRNGFVHSRARAYAEHGIKCDVYKLHGDSQITYDEFEGISVKTGNKKQLLDTLENGTYDKVLVHFLDKDMWQVLSIVQRKIEVITWVHGAEVQPFHRREYNYINSSQEDIQKAKKVSDERISFWRELLKSPPDNLHLVFVSQYFADEVMEDLGFKLPSRSYSIIHNPIDTNIFSYQEKNPSQRLKVLSIRPYASAKYANDLSVKAILELSKEPFFDEMEFRMIGDGPLFDETLEPLRGFKNVHIERRFLKQPEIAELHKHYGIFLTPTRMDAQGVSRDEAMSSGLVPITNSVTAIPEFVDNQCGILASGDDYLGMYAGLKNLYHDSDMFMSLSHNAAQRVRKQTDSSIIIKDELSLIMGT